MIIESLNLSNFRNYDYLDLALAPGVNLFYGDNAQGKTNILESLFVAATTKSHRGSKDKEMIKIGAEDAHIKLMVKKRNLQNRIDMHLKRSKHKGIAINGVPIKRSADLFGIINLVFFSPEDLDIIKDGPSARRRFLDMELSQIDKIYLRDLSDFNKLLQSRNKLLKDMAFKQTSEDEITLDVLTAQLAEAGEKVIAGREHFAGDLKGITKDLHAKISGGREDLEIQYVANVKKGTYVQVLKDDRARDLRFCLTNSGPHKDDLEFQINGADARKYGSQGQQRTIALSLKLAEIELVKSVIHDDPVLLLDDVLSELDSNRQKFLLDNVGSIQTLVTCTGLDEFIEERLKINKIFYVKDGTVLSKN